MNASHAIPVLDAKGLRNFALTTGGIIAVLFGLFFPWLLERTLPRWPWVVLLVLAVWGLAAPRSLQPVYTAWMRFGLLLSKVTTPIVMGLVFYVVIAPIGIVMRIAGRDSLKRRFDPAAASYRQPSEPTERAHLERPF